MLLAVAPEVWVPGAIALAGVVVTTIVASRSSNRAEVLTGFRDLLKETREDRDRWQARALTCETALSAEYAKGWVEDKPKRRPRPVSE